jgi:hypothetical protein
MIARHQLFNGDGATDDGFNLLLASAL